MAETLLLGAGGFLGLHALDALRAQGLDPRCGRRRTSNVLGLRARKARMVEADLDQEESLVAAMRGCRLVLHLAGHYPRTSLHPEATLRAGLGQTRRVLDAAARAGVQRLLYVGSTATVAPVAGRPSKEVDRFPQAPTIGLYHRLKWEMERLVLAEGRLETRVALPSACLGPGDLRVGTSALLIALVRGEDPPHPDGWVDLLDARDLGLGLARLLLAEKAPRRLIFAGHGRRLHPLLRALAARYGVRAPSPPLPPAEAQARADAEETRAEAERRRPRLSRELVDLILHDQRLDARLARRLLGVRPRPLEQTLDDTVAWARRLGLLPSPTEPHPCSTPPTTTASSAS